MTPPLRWDWTPEREALLRERWPTETPSGEIVRALKALPGHIGTYEAAIVKASNMGLRRPNTLGRISNLLPSALTGDVKLKTKIAQMWSEDLSTAEIGRRCNITKNKVVGLSRRMGLPRRANPVKGKDGKVTARPADRNHALKGAKELAKARQASAAPPSPSKPPYLQKQWHRPAEVAAALDFPRPEPVPAMPRRDTVAPPAPSPFRACQFPMGPDTGRVGRHLPFCSASTSDGTSYCAAHARVCFVPRAARLWGQV